MSRSLPLRAIAWISLIGTLGLLTFVFGALSASRLSVGQLAALVLFTVAVVVTDLHALRLTAAFKVDVTVATVVTFGAILIFGPSAVLLALGSAAANILLKSRWSRIIFNAANWSLATWVSSWLWLHLRPDTVSVGPALLQSPLALAACVVSGAAFIALDTFDVFVIVALTQRVGILPILHAYFQGIIVQIVTLLTLGVLLAVLYGIQPLATLLVILPLVAVYYSLRSVEQVRAQALTTIERLMDVLDRRDPSTDQHSERVAQMTRELCEEMGLPGDTTEVTVLAARVHDLGKIGVPDAVLFKPARLDPEEWEIIKKHPVDGADILAAMEPYAGAIPVIRHHHERWDGKGYPDGLSGTAIPLGARIVAVADTFDAMISTRRYRRGIHEATVIAEIYNQAGHQFDPEIVVAFLSMMKAKGYEVPTGEIAGRTAELNP